jgi:signal transduction histidine kinase
MTAPHNPASTGETARLAALYQVSRALGSSLDLDATLQVVMDAAIRLTRAERGFLMLDDDGRGLVFRVARDAAGTALDQSRFQISHTIVDEIMATGQPVITTNARQDPRFSTQDSVVQFALRSILAVPLSVRGRAIGVLYVDNKIRAGLFGPGDLELLNAFAGQAAMAIDNARLYTQTDHALQARVAELQTMQTIDRQLSAGLDFQRVMDVTLDWAVRGTQAETGWIGRLDEAGAALTVLAGQDLEAGQTVSAEQAPLNEALSTGEARQRPPGAERASLAAPVVREGRVVALIVVERAGRAFDAPAVGFLARLADHAAIAMENARLYAAVRQANDAKSEFVRTVSHELKIPMTSIKGYTDLLKMIGPLNAQQEQFVGTIRANVDRMAVLVSDLADISRIESGRLKVELRPVDLRDCLREALNGLRGQLESRQQTVTLQIPSSLPAVRGDAIRLVQVLTNLLSNAHKYSPAGSDIVLRAAPEDSCVRVSVVDHGYGISPADQARLFTQFFRSDEPAIREQNGWGLGLHITKRLVELLGGQIDVQSAPGQGSTFTFTVPLATD